MKQAESTTPNETSRATLLIWLCLDQREAWPAPLRPKEYGVTTLHFTSAVSNTPKVTARMRPWRVVRYCVSLEAIKFRLEIFKHVVK